MAHLTVATDETELAQRAVERVTQLIDAAVAARGVAFVCLSGGATPRRLYANLADAHQPWRERIPWAQLHLFWGDERHVPPEHPDSNYGMAKAALIDQVPIPADHVHRMRGELADAQAAADDYERTLAHVVSAFRRTPNVVSGFSRTSLFDVMLLGLGEDAHIASIFPGSELLPDAAPPFTGRRAAAVWVPHLKIWRITLTPDAILDSRAIVVVVAGANKADAVHAALKMPPDARQYPVQLLRPAADRVEWFLDRAAAAQLRT
jgi:6-phosphogluconolactonase